MKRLRFKFIHRTMIVLNTIVTLLFIIASYSYLISPNQSVLFAYMGLLFPFFLIINIFFLFFWLAFRKWLRFFIALCSLLICWKPITNYVPVNLFPKKAPTVNTIKFLSYNVMGFTYQDHTPTKPNPIISYIIDSDADIVCLQEYLAIENRMLTEEKIANALKMYPYHYTIPLTNFNGYYVGLGFFSKYPIVKSWKVRYDSAFNGSTVHELNIKGKTVYIINNHLESFKLTMGDRRKYAQFIANVNSETFDELLKTVQRKLGSAFYIRAEQADIVADEIQKIKGNYIIVCGDFNDTPISYAYHTVRGDLKDAFEETGNGMGITYNQNNFRFRIDHILHSSNIKAYNATIDKIPYSDHYPIWCLMELK